MYIHFHLKPSATLAEMSAISLPPQTLLTLLTASLQRRHLMVWGVFSPRFLYEAAFMATTDAVVIISYLITSFILNSDTSH